MEYSQSDQYAVPFPLQPQEVIYTDNDNEFQQLSSVEASINSELQISQLDDFLEYISGMSPTVAPTSNELPQPPPMEASIDEAPDFIPVDAPTNGGFCMHDPSKQPSEACNAQFVNNFAISMHMLALTENLGEQFCPWVFCDLSAKETTVPHSARFIRDHFITIHADVSDLEKAELRRFYSLDPQVGLEPAQPLFVQTVGSSARNSIDVSVPQYASTVCPSPNYNSTNSDSTQFGASYQPAPPAGLCVNLADLMLIADPVIEPALSQDLYGQSADPMLHAATDNQLAAPGITYDQAVNATLPNRLNAEDIDLVNRLRTYWQDQRATPVVAPETQPEQPAVGHPPRDRGASPATGIGKHPCTHEGCDKSFTTSQSRKAHEGAQHDGVKLICLDPKCNKLFNDVSNHRRHMQSQHGIVRKRGGEEDFKCEHCDKRFNRKDNWKRHMHKSKCGQIEIQ